MSGRVTWRVRSALARLSRPRPGQLAAPARNPGAPRPRLTLHAGTPKTGTTAIQYALSQNRDHLLAHRLWYPPIADFFPVNPKLNSARAHFAFAGAVAGDNAADRRRVARFMAAMTAQTGAADRILLSAETLYRLTAPPPEASPDAPPAPPSATSPHTSRHAPRPTPLDNRHRFLERLAAVTRDFTPEILLYLRRVDRFAESLYAETMVQTDKNWTFDAFVARMQQRFDYRLQIDTFAAHFPVRVRSFEAAAGAGLIESFCADAAIPAPLPDMRTRTRPSISNTAVLWLARAKQADPAMSARTRERRWHFALRPENAALFETGARTALWSDAGERAAFIDRHQAGVDEIDFPAAGNALPPRAHWDGSRHAEAERLFAAWQDANRAMLRRRERKRIPPYVIDP